MNLSHAWFLLQCCRGLTLVELGKGAALYREGEPGDSFDCIITGTIAILEGGTEVAVLHRPATLGERALRLKIHIPSRAHQNCR